jgi:hypothetical protein
MLLLLLLLLLQGQLAVDLCSAVSGCLTALRSCFLQASMGTAVCSAIL